MKTSISARSMVWLLAVAIVLGGCSASGIQPPLGASARSQIRPSSARLGNGDAANVGFWVTNQSQDYLLGQSKDGNRTLIAIDLSKANCYLPTGLKVDGSQNVWVACNSDYGLANESRVLEYDKRGKLVNSLVWAPCPPNAGFCFTEGWDTAFDSRGNIFASVVHANYSITLNGSTKQFAKSGFEWWASPTVAPIFISAGNRCKPICTIYYLDVDAAGNIWFDYAGQRGTKSGYSLAEVTNPTTNPKVVFPLPIGALGDANGEANGVYASNQGRVLNVTVGPNLGIVDRYRLPVTANSKPFGTLGPTTGSSIGFRAPVAGGFNKDDSSLVMADGLGWLDVGTVPGNKWRRVQSPAGAFGGLIQSAAFTPSDKTSTP
jgi:hypothetical protein